MAKRSSQNLDEGINMDSMMDNMTNVVGVLLLVLIIVQLGVKNSSAQLEEQYANATPEDVEKVQQKLKKAKDLGNKEGAIEEAAEKLKTTQADLREFESSLAKKGFKLEEMIALKKDLKSKQEDESAKKKVANSLLTEIEGLKAALDKTPAPKGPPPLNVRVPLPSEPPANPVFLNILCMSNRIYILREKYWAIQVANTINSNSVALKYFRQPLDPKAGPILDHRKTVDVLNGRNLGDEYVAIQIPLGDGDPTKSTTDRLRMRIVPRQDGGVTAEQMRADYQQISRRPTEPNLEDEEPKESFKFSPFQKNVKAFNFKPLPGVVYQFLIHPSGVAAYHAARELCAFYKVPARWDFTVSTDYSEVLNPRPIVNRLNDLPPSPFNGILAAVDSGAKTITLQRTPPLVIAITSSSISLDGKMVPLAELQPGNYVAQGSYLHNIFTGQNTGTIINALSQAPPPPPPPPPKTTPPAKPTGPAPIIITAPKKKLD